MFEQRSHQKELLDAEDIPRDLLFQNLRELETINKWLGGIAISTKGFRKTVVPQQKVVLADIGCGGGDALVAFAKYARKNNLEAKFIGIDLKQDCIDYATKTCAGFPEISFVKEDYREAIRSQPEITHVHAALFCHHLTDQELLELLLFCKEEGKILIVNDLERHFLAYYSIKWLTRLFRGSSLVQNDAPLSVLRGFKRKEWLSYLEQAGITKFKVAWQWAFRHLILVPNER